MTTQQPATQTNPGTNTNATAPPDLPFDRTTAIGIGALAMATLILIALIGLITLLPAQTITQTITLQAAEQQKVLGGSLARQMEGYFNSLSYDLIGLANRPEVKSTTRASRPAALGMLDELGTLRKGQIKSMVRLSDTGTPLYAWPQAYNQLIIDGKPLPWTATKDMIDNVVRGRTVQLVQRRLEAGGDVAYLLIAPVTEGTNVFEALAMEIDLEHYFVTNFQQAVTLTASGQLWLFDQFAKELYHARPQPAFRGDIAQIRDRQELAILADFPASGLESVIAPVQIGRGSGANSSFVIVLSRAIGEGQETVYNTLRSLFLFGLAIIGFIVVIGIFLGRFLLRESNRRRQEEQRRTTARTLLDISRALNSSLDLGVVLQRILGELADILPHDSASIMLLDKEDPEDLKVTVAAESGLHTLTDKGTVYPLDELKGTREVVMTGKPTLISDCLNDPRWNARPENPTRSWLGIPLRLRNEPVGVLNINSNIVNRFRPDDIELAEAFADQAGVAIQNARAHEVQIHAYEVELQTARAIQDSLLPQEEPPVPQLRVAARTIPARQVSGDYYQYYMLPDGKLGIAVGDVSGKGIPAALLMAVVTTTLRDEIVRVQAPAELLNELNMRLLPRMQQNNMTSALLISIFDPVTRLTEIANGGMVQPYVRNGKGWDFVPVGGYPLGASSRMSYSAKSVTLTPGSTLLFFTDGVIESQNRSQEFFGFERLEALLGDVPPDATPNQVADSILAGVREHLDGQDPQDDITIVVVQSVEA